MDELLNLDNVRQVLEDYAAEVRTLYKDRLMRNDRVASGALLNSVQCRVEVDGRAFEVKMTLEDYWKYVEYDTRPHWPPVSAIQRWIEIKPVIPRPDANGRIPTPKQLAYLISRKISRVGTTGSHDLRDTTQEVNARYRERLQEALAQDVSGLVRRMVTERRF